MRRGNGVRRQPLTRGGVDHAIADEIRQRLFGEMLDLTAAANREMPAWRRRVPRRPRRRVMRTGLERAIGPDPVAGRGEGDMAPAGGDPVAFGGDANDRLRLAHANAAATAPCTASASCPAENVALA